ncbi:MAG: threonine--tRNA ligase [Candidatus Omnitrophica bacterium]|nr:threonine--tRNA ligase [Candidatus Omnitrophota bacterium]
MEDEILKLRHSTAHVMADAVKQLFPQAKLGIGPAIENGFYYDFDLDYNLSPEDFIKIEQKMAEIIKRGYIFTKKVVTRQEAYKIFEQRQEPYKLELIDAIKEQSLSLYEHGGFIDLCKGPHLERTSDIKAFKLLSVAGAYWRGEESNKMLHRIYATVFPTEQELASYLCAVEEAEKRDHRKLGQRLGLFTFFPQAGAGLVFYLPKGALLRKLIENYILRQHLARGYDIVLTPQILKSDVWKTSGHYEYYKEHMYIFQSDNNEYAVKPMNCPGHIMIYKSRKHSYKELPIRFFELGTVYRHEKAGVLHGLLRVRGFTQDDAHIFCREDQLKKEIVDVIVFMQEIMRDFGFNSFEIELSTRPESYIGQDEQWQKATEALQESLQELKIDYKTCPGEGAFYGPKIDIKLKDAIGRMWQCATIQCDFALPERFDVTYVGEDGANHRAIMLHRAILGSLERFLGTLIEHYGGEFPLWLAPEQLRIIPVSEKFLAYAQKLKRILEQDRFRTSIDARSETLGYRVREAEIEKVPYLLICGKKEEQSNTVSLRSRGKKEESGIEINILTEKLKEEIGDKGI